MKEWEIELEKYFSFKVYTKEKDFENKYILNEYLVSVRLQSENLHKDYVINFDIIKNIFKKIIVFIDKKTINEGGDESINLPSFNNESTSFLLTKYIYDQFEVLFKKECIDQLIELNEFHCQIKLFSSNDKTSYSYMNIIKC